MPSAYGATSRLDLPYAVFADVSSTWSYNRFEGKPIDVTDRFERRRADPHRRVRIEHTSVETGPMPSLWAATRGEEPRGVADVVRRACPSS